LTLATGNASYNDQTIVLNLSGVTVSPGDIITVTIADSTIQSAIDGTYVTGQTFQNVDIFNCVNTVIYLDTFITNYGTNSGTWNDLSENGNNATLINTPTYGTSNDGYLIFNGSNQYATIPHSSAMNLIDNHSISVWFYQTSSTASSVALFGKTPLIWAAEKGHQEAVLALLNAGADKDAKNKVSTNLI
jgi:hypothetical protein